MLCRFLLPRVDGTVLRKLQFVGLIQRVLRLKKFVIGFSVCDGRSERRNALLYIWGMQGRVSLEARQSSLVVSNVPLVQNELIFYNFLIL